MSHIFNASIAVKFSVDVAILIQCIGLKDETTLKDLKTNLPFFTSKQIKNLLEICITNDLVDKGYFPCYENNGGPFYTLSQKGLSLSRQS